MPAATYRPIRDEEIEDALDLFMASVNEMTARHGLPGVGTARGAFASSYQHIFQTGLFEVAEVDGAMAGIGHAIVRDQLWFLSGFWVRPGEARQGIGGPLLRRLLEAGRARGATHFFTWSSVDVTAMATYLRSGLLPGTQILTFTGRPSASPVPEPGELTPLRLEQAATIDAVVRAVRREEDHRFFLRERVGRALRSPEGTVLGYFYAGGGVIGPAAWLDPAHGERLLSLALGEADGQGHEVRVAATGHNLQAIGLALRSGLRLTSTAHLLTSAPFGQLDRYLPSGPSLF